MTPLHWACEHNHVDIVKILLRAGAKIDIKSKVRFAFNRPFEQSSHMLQNFKLCWDASYTVGLLKQRKVGLDWYKLLCFGSPSV